MQDLDIKLRRINFHKVKQRGVIKRAGKKTQKTKARKEKEEEKKQLQQPTSKGIVSNSHVKNVSYNSGKNSRSSKNNNDKNSRSQREGSNLSEAEQTETKFEALLMKFRSVSQ